MNKLRSSVILLVALLVASAVSGQTVTTNTVRYVQKAGVVNFAEMANYYKAHPSPLVKRLPFDEGNEAETRPKHPLADPSSIYDPAAHRAEKPHLALLSASPSPTDTFMGQTTDGEDIPPDVNGAVNATYVVSTHNDSVIIQSRTGAVLYGAGIDNFWHSLESSGTGAYDPRVLFDPHYNRWIMVADCYGELATSQIMIAVSQTSNPTGSWNMYKIATGSGTGSGHWLDFPNVGFNRNWIAVSGNFFQVTGSGSFIDDSLYIFDYTSMMTGTAGAYGAFGPAGGSFSIMPAATFDTTENSLFCTESWNGAGGQLRLYKVTGAIGAGLTLNTVATPASTIHWASAGNASQSDFVPQVASTYSLQANDDRVNNCQQRNNQVWCAHTAFFPAGGSPNRASAMWWELDTNGTIAQNDTIDDNTHIDNYFFPSVSVNANNDALIGFAHSSVNIHPSCAYALHMHTDPASSHRSVITYKHGQNTYYQTFGGGENRWGDYTATCTDPTNNLDFWTLQESVPTTANRWNTWWAYVRVCGSLAAPTDVTEPATTQCAGTSAWYYATPVAGATGYTWTVTGTGWTYTTSAGTDSVDLTASASAGTVVVTVAANDSCGPGTQYSFTVTPLAIPNETITTPDSICAGATSAIFNATATGSPTSYSWAVLGTGWSGSSTTSSLSAVVGSGTGTIIVNAVNGCGTGPNDTLYVTPGTPPGAATGISSSATVYCIDGTATLTTPAVSGATSYIWSVTGTGWSGTSTTNTINITVGTGTGNITVTPVNACGDGTPFTLSGIVPTTAPVPTFSESPMITTDYSNVTITYLGAVSSGETFAWTFVSGTPSTGTGSGTQNVYWTTPGTYTVTLTVNDGGCISSFTDTVEITPGLAVKKVTPPSFNANIVPNPNTGSFNIVFDQQTTLPVSVKISDMEGHTVYTNDFGNINSKTLPIVTDHLASGTYNATIFVDGTSITRPITIIGK